MGVNNINIHLKHHHLYYLLPILISTLSIGLYGELLHPTWQALKLLQKQKQQLLTLATQPAPKPFVRPPMMPRHHDYRFQLMHGLFQLANHYHVMVREVRPVHALEKHAASSASFFKIVTEGNRTAIVSFMLAMIKQLPFAAMVMWHYRVRHTNDADLSLILMLLNYEIPITPLAINVAAIKPLFCVPGRLSTIPLRYFKMSGFISNHHQRAILLSALNGQHFSVTAGERIGVENIPIVTLTPRYALLKQGQCNRECSILKKV